MIDPPQHNHTSPTSADRLAIPEHALAALEYQARRHYRRWRLERAEELARRVVRLDVGRLAAWFVLGDIEMRRMNWPRAFDHFQQAVDCCRTDALAWCRGGEALLHMGQYAHAERWLRRAINASGTRGSAGARRAKKLLKRYRTRFERAQEASAGDGALAPTQKLPSIPPVAGDRRRGKRRQSVDDPYQGER